MSSIDLQKELRKDADKRFLLGAGAAVASVAVLRRTNWLLFPAASPAGYGFAFAPFSFSGYSGSAAIGALGASGLSFIGSVILLITLAANLLFIASVAASSAIFIANAVPSLGAQFSSLAPASQVPLAVAAVHAVESVILFLGLLSGSNGLASLAGLIGYLRGLGSLGSVVLVVAIAPLFLREWAFGIGRDGRQRVEKTK